MLMIKIGKHSGHTVDVIFGGVHYILNVSEWDMDVPVYVTYKPIPNSWEAYQEGSSIPLTIESVYKRVF